MFPEQAAHDRTTQGRRTPTECKRGSTIHTSAHFRVLDDCAAALNLRNVRRSANAACLGSPPLAAVSVTTLLRLPPRGHREDRPTCTPPLLCRRNGRRPKSPPRTVCRRRRSHSPLTPGVAWPRGACAKWYPASSSAATTMYRPPCTPRRHIDLAWACGRVRTVDSAPAARAARELPVYLSIRHKERRPQRRREYVCDGAMPSARSTRLE